MCLSAESKQRLDTLYYTSKNCENYRLLLKLYKNEIPVRKIKKE